MSVVQNSINANATTPLTVVHGGTGVNTLTSDGILYGNGTGAIQVANALTNGQLLIGSTGNPPVPATITAGTNISVVNTPGVITISNIGYAAQSNIIIGGDFGTNAWARQTSFSSVATNQYTADRFAWSQSGTGAVTISQQADAPTQTQANYLSQDCLQVAVTTANSSLGSTDLYGIYYRVEGYDFQQIAQQAFTLSFWVKSPLTGTYCMAFNNSGADHSYVTTYTINSANTWEQKVINVSASPSAGTWNYTNGVGLQIFFTLAAGSSSQTATTNTWQASNFFATSAQVNLMNSTSNTFKIDLVKLEAGSNATNYISRPYTTERLLMNRYYYKTYTDGVYAGASTSIGTRWGVVGNTNGDIATGETFITPMRATPTVNIYSVHGVAGDITNYTTGTDLTGTFAGSNVGAEGFLNLFSSGTTVVVGQSYYFHYTSVAEL
jgi:hypothetical protein